MRRDQVSRIMGGLTMRVIHWREHDAYMYRQASWHRTLKAALDKARKIGASYVVHYPADSMREEHWITVKAR